MMFVRIIPFALAMGLLLFVPAGRLDVPAFWAYLALFVLGFGGTYTALARLGWSAVPLWIQAAGFACAATAFALVAWTLFTNPFASSAVRVQTERDHRVISGGPYAFVRHPMYLAVLLLCALLCAGAGAALGSWWSAVALAPVVLVFVRRTLLEDRMLHEELKGYSEYAARVRWRVLPGVF